MQLLNTLLNQQQNICLLLKWSWIPNWWLETPASLVDVELNLLYIFLNYLIVSHEVEVAALHEDMDPLLADMHEDVVLVESTGDQCNLPTIHSFDQTDNNEENFQTVLHAC